jgi:hypothetical protein
MSLWNELYLECSSCGHHLAQKLDPSVIVNEELSLTKMEKMDSLDRFKSKTLLANSAGFECLIDVGSGSGKFLYQNKKYFKRAIGIEVSPDCVEFSRKQLNLQIVDRFPNEEKATAVSFWHSLEHLTLSEIRQILAAASAHSDPKVSLIISVPGGQSLLHRKLKTKDPYYDPTSHFHEFSYQSLSLILKKCGFRIEKSLYSFPYSLFGWVQGLSNLFHPVRNYFYYRFRRSNTVKVNPIYDGLSVALFILMLPFGLVLALLDAFRPQNACVINVVAKKS